MHVDRWATKTVKWASPKDWITWIHLPRLQRISEHYWLAGFSIFMHLFGSPGTLKEPQSVPVSAICKTEQDPNLTSAAFSMWKDTPLQVCFCASWLCHPLMAFVVFPLGQAGTSRVWMEDVRTWRAELTAVDLFEGNSCAAFLRKMDK